MGLMSRAVGAGVASTEPHIEVFDDFASPDECRHMIELAAGDMGAAGVIRNSGENEENNLRRTANVGWVYTDQDPKVRSLVGRVAELARMPARNCERIQVVQYEPGGKYTPHLDTFAPSSMNESNRPSGQRLKTGLLYLQEPGKGGSTSFPKAGAKVKPQTGRLVLFDLVLPGTSDPDERAVHAGNPVWSGEKWACNFWFCENPVKHASRKSARGSAVNSSRSATKKRPKKRKKR